jgi:hypothetical protein
MTVAPNARPRQVLVLYWDSDDGSMRPAIRLHLRALAASPVRHRVLYHNVFDGMSAGLRLLQFDSVILHTTLLCLRCSHHFPRVKWALRWLTHTRAVKIALPQDEYDHSEILDEWLYELGVSVVYTNFDERVRPLLYPLLHRCARFVQCLTGYIGDQTAAALASGLRPVKERPFDLVYRACHLPYWFGSHGQLKHTIADAVRKRAPALGLRCDISTRPQDTITSDDWFSFLASARATIGCESGSSVLDRRGEIQARVCWLTGVRPTLSFDQVAAQMPRGWDAHCFFAMGPRHLEAVITRTCQILIEGEYGGVLKPHRHYIPLRRDLGNLDEVLHQVKDHALLEATAARAYEEVYLSGSHTYAAFARRIEESLPEPPSRTWLGRFLSEGGFWVTARLCGRLPSWDRTIGRLPSWDRTIRALKALRRYPGALHRRFGALGSRLAPRGQRSQAGRPRNESKFEGAV